MNCEKCGTPINECAQFCGKCGHKVITKTEALNTNEKQIGVCPTCGNTYDVKADKLVYCKECGFNLKGDKSDTKKKDRSITNFVGKLVAVIIICVTVVIYLSLNSTKISEPDIIDTYKSEEEISNSDSDEYDSTINDEAIDSDDVTEMIEDFGIPFFNSISASSELAPEGNNNYYCQNVTDGNSNTAWVEGVSGSGIGESIIFSSDERQRITGIKILNGYCKSERLYKKNNRIKEIKMSFSDGSIITKLLQDNFSEYDVIELDKPIICTYFMIKIEDVYRGTDYDDTCISEIKVY